MKDIHNNPLFTDITAEEEVSVHGGGLGGFLLNQINKEINNPMKYLTVMKWAFDTLYDYHKRTDPYRDSKGRIIAS